MARNSEDAVNAIMLDEISIANYDIEMIQNIENTRKQSLLDKGKD